MSFFFYPPTVSELRDGPWFEIDDRLLKEYDRVREISLKLLFGPQEKMKRIGHGKMEEPVFTVGPFKGLFVFCLWNDVDSFVNLV